MSDKTDSKPEIIPAYGEVGMEAKSMERAAEGAAPAADDAVNASEASQATETSVDTHGTTKSDIPGRTAETAKRKAAQMPD